MGFQFSKEIIKQATDMYFERLMTQEEIAEKLGGPSQASISRWIRLDSRYNVASVNRSSVHPQQVVRVKERGVRTKSWTFLAQKVWVRNRVSSELVIRGLIRET